MTFFLGFLLLVVVIVMLFHLYEERSWRVVGVELFVAVALAAMMMISYFYGPAMGSWR